MKSQVLGFCFFFIFHYNFLKQGNIWFNSFDEADIKDKVNFKIFEFTAWEINNCNTHIAKHLEK